MHVKEVKLWYPPMKSTPVNSAERKFDCRHSRPQLLTQFYLISFPPTATTNPRTKLRNPQRTNVITVSQAQLHRIVDRNNEDKRAPNKAFDLLNLREIYAAVWRTTLCGERGRRCKFGRGV
ncbi:hypothetical protein KC19_VG075000 [Ceratodon purpureus]|uniref:Uncharacterized protein n=1 Tax=Ceratodon purpureus TaxID=3225 RepID=A0A8T0HMZ2_CERPU|nr:hypothetical protein KC19_VG075000 [Ceratodon purpureus]